MALHVSLLRSGSRSGKGRLSWTPLKKEWRAHAKLLVGALHLVAGLLLSRCMTGTRRALQLLQTATLDTLCHALGALSTTTKQVGVHSQHHICVATITVHDYLYISRHMFKTGHATASCCAGVCTPSATIQNPRIGVWGLGRIVNGTTWHACAQPSCRSSIERHGGDAQGPQMGLQSCQGGRC